MKVSETFVAEAATGAASYPGGGTGASPPAKSSLSIQYDVEAKRYTITRAGRTSGFDQSHQDAGSSNAAFAAYRFADGTAQQSLRLTKPGTSGAFNQEFVGAGLWRAQDLAGGVDLNSFGAFTYGFRSPGADVPTTGNASFGVGLVAVAATSDGLTDVYGTGLFSVDFATRKFTVQGEATRRISYAGSVLPPSWFAGGFSGSGIVASGANAFMGSLDVEIGPRYVTTLNGFFYGPSLSEVGATVSGFNTSNQALIGALVGRRADAPPQFETLANLIAPITLQELTRQVRYRENPGGDGYSQASLDGNSQSSLSIEPATGLYNYSGIVFSRKDRVAAQSDARFTTYQTNGAVSRTLKVYNPGPGNADLALSYTSFISSTNIVASENRRWDSHTIFGMETYGGNVPRSGHGVFDARVFGSAVGAGSGADRFSIEGTAGFDFDFAGATLTGSMSPFATNLRTGDVSQLGSYTFENGQIFPFSLAFGADISGTPGASGALNGRFYGPSAQEIGATFGLITPGAGTVLTGAGVIVGKRR